MIQMLISLCVLIALIVIDEFLHIVPIENSGKKCSRGIKTEIEDTS